MNLRPSGYEPDEMAARRAAGGWPSTVMGCSTRLQADKKLSSICASDNKKARRSELVCWLRG